ncbi:unnamed protein product [Staurois parvus]|uniref:Uncharacterized protein n=1 Tax=Staurois parvus TaxID=386267 RepID=A0ABN9HN85_9NEOB|nr:unnamed protein product [Staurois parvus]
MASPPPASVRSPQSGARCVLRSLYRTSVRGPDHVITDWPISDH